MVHYLIKRIFFGAITLCIGAFVFAQTPYNVVMNIYGDPTTQMAFNWFTDEGVAGGEVIIMKDTQVVQRVKAITFKYPGYTVNKAVVKNLEPGTIYSFKVGKENAWSDEGTFTTAKRDKTPFSFIYTTDQQPNFPELQEILQTNSRAVFSKNTVDFWIDCGDLVHHGGELNLWNTLFNAHQDKFLKTPFAPVQGNHDEKGKMQFGRHFNTEKFGVADKSGSTYTYIYGDAQFFAINGEKCNNAVYIGKVKKWMKAQIKANPALKWRMVYFHKNVYTGAKDEQNSKLCAVWFKAITPLFDALNIDIVFQGHSHVYDVIGPVKKAQLIPESVSNVKQNQELINFPKNVNGKSGGIFNVKEGTLYFTNGTFGNAFFNPLPLEKMPGKHFPFIPHYASLITGKLAQAGNPTYSHISVSTESVLITTYEIVNGNSVFFDEITIIKN